MVVGFGIPVIPCGSGVWDPFSSRFLGSQWPLQVVEFRILMVVGFGIPVATSWSDTFLC